MIPRYTRPEMAAIWEAENRFRIWLEIETLACEKMAALGVIPDSVPKSIARIEFRWSAANTTMIKGKSI